jgi:virginiamycin B lyase
MSTPNARPYGIVLDNDGRPYFDLFGTNKIGTVDPKTFEAREFVLPEERSRPRRIARTTDGHIWYVDYSRGFLGRLDPKTGRTPVAGRPCPTR